ncbi:hypothetical protein DERF_014688 [Dermatophagoides farinae]|uniref:Uncharacterized protein n=1 Tax=Dermatophagoides farinae TaxID=6954 RepID=A0A922KZE1_DERFA|nr:hypothetical protein DERF_014688 [Dermatophagoides farinae]
MKNIEYYGSIDGVDKSFSVIRAKYNGYNHNHSAISIIFTTATTTTTITGHSFIQIVKQKYA